jgi:anti-anti-sigma regulatory factor
MQIELETRDQGAALVNVQGRLDAAAAPTFEQKITDAIS